MSFATPKDVSLFVSSQNASSERRFSPSLSLAQVKAKLETVTGIPPSQQVLTIHKSASTRQIRLEANDEDSTLLQNFDVEHHDTLQVDDLRPESARINFSDTSGVEKYEMDKEEYSKLNDSVLAWKKRNKLGRFDPARSEHADSALKSMEDTIQTRGITKGARCRVGDPSLERLGEVLYVGTVEEILGGGMWVGVCFDEPVGKNDGSVSGKRYFQAPDKHGSFVRPDRVEVGDFPKKDINDDLFEEI